MAMYPNATKGYMPFVTAPVKRHQGKRTKSAKESSRSKGSTSAETKTYKVTLRDRNGYTYTYIIQADGTKSLPVLCESKISGPGNDLGSSLPEMARESLSRRRRTLSTESADSESDDCEKKGIFNTLLQFLRKKTASGKSKRKPKTVVQRKRQRTISTMSNLDPIQESPEEDNADEDDYSYTHDSSTDNDSVSGNEP
ncbi:hypothetical protein SNE40_013964 [Patella caerulea]|uniref:Uncharacterized protein n=1 Tax=Patella caerulea TaxID=87958 RepID=A0AAN8PRK5_PATCE